MPSRIEEPDREGPTRSGRSQGLATDDALMARIAEGDARAFEEVVNAHLSRVVAVARRVLGSDSEAEDVAQEALLRLWRQADRWEPGRARITTWLYRVTVNLGIDRLRRRGETVDADPPEQIAEADQQRHMEEEELRSQMDAALQSLPERQRIALVLFHYEGLSMAEAAAIMETSVEALESLLARARRTLKQQLAGAWRTLLPDQGG